MDMPARTRWRMLIISLPSRSATPRMRVWRALKALGAAVLRDGVYLLPDNEAAVQALATQASEVIGSGGTAQVLVLDQPDLEQERHFRSLFDRNPDYSRLIESLRAVRAKLRRRGRSQATRVIKQLRREYDAVRATDFFAGPAAEQAGQMLSEAETALAALLSPDEPQPQAGRIARLDIKAYRNRSWATRARPWVDRMASAWLIKRFIDPKARFRWLKNPKDCPRAALGFDFDGATFTHVGARVTFEVLVASFGLEDDKALVRLGELVHFLDVGGVPVAEARGLEMILTGARTQYRDDDKLLAEASKNFDYLYQAYSEK
ncbi:MAG TPA: chromate resistance protein ChrB domain-containing protein [Burkholderiales bacterium]|nr:chromate resistance protein ChrB domain-containing protein [Burkholderiales bacterium]